MEITLEDKINRIYDLAVSAFESQKIQALTCQDDKAQADKMLAANKLLETAVNALKVSAMNTKLPAPTTGSTTPRVVNNQQNNIIIPKNATRAEILTQLPEVVEGFMNSYEEEEI